MSIINKPFVLDDVNMKLGDKINILLNRECGPFLNKPNLPAGGYLAEIVAMTYNGEFNDVNIHHNGHYYCVERKDFTITR